MLRNSGFMLLLVAVGPALAQEPVARTANNGSVILEDVPEVPAAVVEKVSRYQNVRSAAFRDWTEDGRAIYISTRFGDVNQIHRVDRPGGTRHQLTFFEEPVGGVTRRPGHGEFVFSMDEGGNEFFQLFLYDPETGEHSRLTDGASRNGSPHWSQDGWMLAYRSTRRNGRSNDLWIMNVRDTSTARLLLEAPGGSSWTVTDWSLDGRSMLVTEYISITDSRVYVVDAATSNQRLVSGGDASPGNYVGIDPAFAPDGRGFFLASDENAEFTHLAYQDLTSDSTHVITGDIPWNVESFAMSANGRRAAFSVNEGGISSLYLMDPETFEYRQLDAGPSGVITGISFSPDGQHLAFTVTTPTMPGDVFTVDLSDGGSDVTRWTYSELGGLSTEAFVEPEMIDYPTFDEVDGEPRMIPAFIYRPEGPGPHPVIISIHGGPESQYRPRFSSRYQLWLKELGTAVIAPNVRGSSGYGKDYVKLDNWQLRENSVRDIGALLDWIATQPDLDANRVAVYGGSYGGYMVLATAVHYSDRLAVAVERVGISNFVTFLENTQSYRQDLRRPEYGDERIPEMREFLESVSPNRHADAIRVPLFVAQGQNDPRVPVTESEQIVREIRANGGDVWYMNALNEGHGFRKKENQDLYAQIALMFLERHLLGGPLSMR